MLGSVMYGREIHSPSNYKLKKRGDFSLFFLGVGIPLKQKDPPENRKVKQASTISRSPPEILVEATLSSTATSV